MLKKIFKEIGRFILVVFLYSLYNILCIWLIESFSFIERALLKVDFNGYLLLISIIPILITLCLFKKSKGWFVDLIAIILILLTLHFIVEEKESKKYTEPLKCKVDTDCPQPRCMAECGSVCKSGRCIGVSCKTHGKLNENFECICNEGWTGRFCEKEIIK